MDTEKYIEIQEAVNNHPAAAGDFYFHAELAMPAAPAARKRLSFRKVTSIALGVGAVAASIVAASAGYPLFNASLHSEIAAFAGSTAVAAIIGAGVGFGRRRMMKQAAAKLVSQTIYPIEKQLEKQQPASIITVVYPNIGDFPASDTHTRDKLASAKLALLSLDPAKTVRQ